MSEVNTNPDFDLLDGSVDELADLKGFEPFPEGSYKLSINWNQKEINDCPAVILKLTCVEVLELSDKTKEAPEVGKSVDIAYIYKRKDKNDPKKLVRNEVAEGQLKEVLQVLQPVFTAANNRELMAASEGAEIAATLKVRADKNDPDKKYNQIKECALA